MDLNLYLTALLVIGLAPQPSFNDYFKEDADGIFGSTWMQQHFTRHKWDFFHAHTHFIYNNNLVKIPTGFDIVIELLNELIVIEMSVGMEGWTVERRAVEIQYFEPLSTLGDI